MKWIFFEDVVQPQDRGERESGGALHQRPLLHDRHHLPLDVLAQLTRRKKRRGEGKTDDFHNFENNPLI